MSASTPTLGEITTPDGPQRAFILGCWAWVPTTTQIVYVPTGARGMSWPAYEDHRGLSVLKAVADAVPDWNGRDVATLGAAWKRIQAQMIACPQDFEGASTNVLPIFNAYEVEVQFTFNVAALGMAGLIRLVAKLSERLNDEFGIERIEVSDGDPTDISRVMIGGELCPVDGLDVEVRA